MIRRPPSSTPFPYTTLFRPGQAGRGQLYDGSSISGHLITAAEAAAGYTLSGSQVTYVANRQPTAGFQASDSFTFRARSEEHTSELQSRQYLVCRLLLEKKNI